MMLIMCFSKCSGTRHDQIKRALLVFLGVALVLTAGCGGRRSGQYTQQGNTYLRLKKVVDARVAYERAIKADPQNAEARLGLARCYSLEKNSENALNAYREAVQADPSLQLAYLEAVKLLLGEAADDYTENIEAQVMEFVEAFEGVDAERGGMLRAFVLRQTGREKEALHLLTQLRDKFEQSAGVRVALASAYVAANKPEQAEQELKRVLEELDANSVAARMTLIELYRTQGRLPEIVEQMKQLVAQQPDDAGLKLALARSLFDSGQVDEAEATARPVLEANPESGWANYVVGCCLLEKDAYGEAVECLETAANALPHETGVVNMLARARSGGTEPGGLSGVPDEGAVSPPAAAAAAESASPSWQDLWRSARLRQLLAERETFLEQDEPNLRESLVLAALLTGARPLADELGMALSEDAPLRKYLTALQERNPEALSEALQAWEETDPERQIIRDNAEGLAYALNGARARALRTLSECIRKRPDNGVALFNLAGIYRAAQMPRFAAGCLQKLIATYRDNMEARELLFRIMLAADLKEEAQQSAELTYSLFPNRSAALIDLARIYRITGKNQLAIRVLDRGAQTLPDDDELRLRLAEAYLYADDPTTALAAIDKAPVPPELADLATTTSAFAMARTGDWEGTIERCAATGEQARPLPLRLLESAALLKTNQTDAAHAVLVEDDARVSLGGREARILLLAFGKSAGETQAEDEQLAEALSSAGDALGDYAYGAACRVMGLFPVAVEALRRANDAAPGQPGVVGPLLYCLAQGDSTEENVTLARDLASANAGMPTAWLGLAEVLRAAGDEAGEHEALDKALEVGSEDAVVWRQRAQFFERQGDNASVEAAYRRLAERMPDDPNVANNLAYCILRDDGDAAEALKWAERAVEQLPTNPHVLHTAGLAELRTGALEASLKHLSLALQIRPGDPTILLDFGQVLIASDRKEEGEAHIRLALQYTDQLNLDFPRRAEAEAIVAAGTEQRV